MTFFRFIALFSLALLLAGPRGFGQQAAVRVKDSKTGQPVPYAYVIFQPVAGGPQTQALTGEDGTAKNPAVAKSVVTISFVGYETLSDTVDPGESVTLSMKPKIQEMNEVVVTAQYSPQRVDKSIYKVKVINSLQIEQKAANNLTDLLSTELNIRITQDGVLGSSLSLQGLSGENVKFLVDGVPVIGRMNGNIDISQLNLYNVDHIELIEGPMSVVYGSNALAGVINIITKENKTTRLSTFARSYIESVGVYNFDLGASYKIKDHVISISGGRNFFDGYSENDSLRSLGLNNKAENNWKPKRQYFVDGYYLFSKPKLKFKVSSSWFDEKILNRGNLMGPYYETAFDNYFLTTRSTSKIELNQQIDDHRYINLMGSYGYYSRIKDTFFKDLTTLTETPTTNPEDHDTTIFHDALFRGTFSKSNPNSHFNYQLGFDLNYEVGLGKRMLDDKQEIGDYASFLSVQYEPLKWVSIQPGIRYIYNTKFKAPLVYSLNLKFAFRDNYNIRASYSRGFRAPSLKELYLYFVDVNHNVQGNPELQSENSHNVNLSFQYNRETNKTFIGTELNFFYNHINNLITLAQSAGTLYTYVNVDKYLTQGFELAVNYRIYPWLIIRSGGGFTGRYNSLSDETGQVRKFYYSPDAVMTTTYQWQKVKMDFTLDYKYTGKMPQLYTRPDGGAVVGYVSAYNTMDFTMQKSFLKDMLTIGAGVKNIFDVTTIPAVGGSGGVHTGGGGDLPVGWGRSFFVQAAVNFNKF
jgi:outer membrane receptor for ferrienterochelin and colicins